MFSVLDDTGNKYLHATSAAAWNNMSCHKKDAIRYHCINLLISTAITASIKLSYCQF
jgi:hypothetical protein